MDMKKRKFNNLQGLIILVLVTIQVTAASNINCNGKAFHCVNSTHFMICVDVGGGLSSTIDNFVIPCPPTTECHPHNRFECEFPPITSRTPIIEPLASTTQAAETAMMPLHISTANTDYPQTVSEAKTNNYLNIVSPTTVSEKAMNSTTKNVTESTFILNVETLRGINETTVPPQSLKINEFITTTDATTKAIAFTAQQTVSSGNGTDVTSTILLTKDDIQHDYSTTAPSKIEATTTNIYTSADITTNKLPEQSSTINKFVTMTDPTTEAIASTEYETISSRYVMDVTSNILFPKDITQQNNSTTVPSNIETTTQNIHTNTDLTTNKLLVQSSSIKEFVNASNTTMELIASTVNQAVFTRNGTDATSNILLTKGFNQQNYSTTAQNNIEPTTQNIYTRVDLTTNKLPVQSSSTTEIVTITDATTEAIASTAHETVSSGHGTDVASNILLTKDIIQQNYFTTAPSTIETTIQNIYKSADLTTNKLPVQSSGINDIVISTDATTEAIASTTYETLSSENGTGVTTNILLTKVVIQPNYFTTVPSNIETTTQNIYTSANLTTNKLPVQSSDINEFVTTTDATTEAIASRAHETVSSENGTDVASNILVTKDVIQQNYFTTAPSNIETTTQNIYTSADLTTNKLPVQSSVINEFVTTTDATTEAIASTTYETLSSENGTGVTTNILLTKDVIQKNYFTIAPNNMVTTAQNIYTSADLTTNKLPVQSSSMNDFVPMTDATTEAIVSTAHETVSLGNGTDVNSNILLIKDVDQQNYTTTAPSNIETTTQNIYTSADLTISKLPVQSSDINEFVTTTDATTEAIATRAHETVSSENGSDVASNILLTKDVIQQNYLTTVPSNIETTTQSIYTSADLTTNKLPVQSSSMNDFVPMTDATTEAIVSTANETVSLGNGTDVKSNILLTKDVDQQNYTTTAPSNIETTTQNIYTSADITTNKLPVQSSGINEFVTTTDATTEAIASTTYKTLSSENGTGVTTNVLLTKDVIQQNYFTTAPSNIETTTQNIYTSADITINKLPVQSSGINEFVTTTDATTEAIASTTYETLSSENGTGVTTNILLTKDVIQQNYFTTAPSNIETTTQNIYTSADITTNKLPVQSSGINEFVTTTDATTEAIASTTYETLSSENGTGVTTNILLTKDVIQQNYFTTVPSNIETTTQNIYTSADLTTNKLPVQSSGINEFVTMTDATTEAIASREHETVSSENGTDVASNILLTKDVIQQTYFTTVPSNIETTTQNIYTSADLTTNKLPVQSSGISEFVTMTDATTEAIASRAHETVSSENGTDVASNILLTKDVTQQNYFTIAPSNIETTTRNIYTSADLTTNKLPVQSSGINEFVTTTDATTEAIASTTYKTLSSENGTGVTTNVLLTKDVIQQNYFTTAPSNIETTTQNIYTSADITTNKLPVQSSGINEFVTTTDATTEAIASTTYETISSENGTGVTTNILLTKDVIQQNYFTTAPSNIETTTQNIYTSADITTNKLPVQSSGINEFVTTTDATTEAIASTTYKTLSTENGTGVTTNVLLTKDVIQQNYFTTAPSNIETTTRNIYTSGDLTTNKLPLQSSGINNVVIRRDATTDAIASTTYETLSSENGTGVTTNILLTKDVIQQNYFTTAPSTIETTIQNIYKSADLTTYKLPVQSSGMHDFVTMTDATKEAIASTTYETLSSENGTGVTTNILLTKDVIQKTNFTIAPNNIVTTAQDIYTSAGLTTNKLPVQSSSMNDFVPMTDATTEAIVSTAHETVSLGNGTDINSNISVIKDVVQQNYTTTAPSNIETTTQNIYISADLRISKLPVQRSDINEFVTTTDATTEEMASTTYENLSSENGTGVTTNILLTKDVIQQNYFTTVPSYIETTTQNIYTSADLTTIKLPVQSSSINEVVTRTDATTEAISTTAHKTVSSANGTDITSSILLTKDVIQKNYSTTAPSYVETTTENVYTRADLTTNKLQVQSPSIYELAAMLDSTTETVINTERINTRHDTDIFSNNLFTKDVIQKNHESKTLIDSQKSRIDVHTTTTTKMYLNTASEFIIPNQKQYNYNKENVTSEIFNKSLDGDEKTIKFTKEESYTQVNSGDINSSTPINKSSLSSKSDVNIILTTNDNMATVDIPIITRENNKSFTTRLMIGTPQLSAPPNDHEIFKMYPNYKQNNSLAFANKHQNKTNDKSYNAKQEQEILILLNKSDTKLYEVDATANTSKRFQTENNFIKITHNDSSITNELIAKRGNNNTTPDEVIKNDQKSIVNNAMLLNRGDNYLKNESYTRGIYSHITVPSKGYYSATTALPIFYTRKYVPQTATHNESIQTTNPHIQSRNTNHKRTQNRSVIYTEVQSNNKDRNIANNTLQEDQDKSFKFNKMQRNTDNIRKTAFNCRHRFRGRYADNLDCRKFYICIGREQPIVGMCPVDTVFSMFRKQCTSNLSHCIINNQFHCTSEGRFSDFVQNNVYYICVKDAMDKFVRFKLQCQNGYYLNRTSIHCSPKVEESSQSGSSVSDNSNTNSDQSATKSTSDDSSRSERSVFQCTEEGKFADPTNCTRYYVCSRSSKLGYKIKRKSCDEDNFFNKEKKKCIDDDSSDC